MPLSHITPSVWQQLFLHACKPRRPQGHPPGRAHWFRAALTYLQNHKRILFSIVQLLLLVLIVHGVAGYIRDGYEDASTNVSVAVLRSTAYQIFLSCWALAAKVFRPLAYGLVVVWWIGRERSGL